MTTRPLSLPVILKSTIGVILLWVLLSTAILYFYLQFSLLVAIADSVISVLFLTAGCAIVSNMLGYYQPKNEKLAYFFILVAILTTLIVYCSFYGLRYLFYNEAEYIKFLKASLICRQIVCFVCVAWCALTNMLWYKLEEQAETQKRLHAAENLAKEAELNKLRHQLQPHFLFNSLNSVYALTIVNPTEAGTMITKLAAFLRGTLKREDDIWVKVEEEMEYIQLYLDIEKVRFSHRLNVVIDIAEDSKSQLLPGTLLQPIVENAIKFGLYNTSKKITISIFVKLENNVLLIRVENPFDPTSTPTKGTGFGLSAIRRRLYLLFADSNLLQTEIEDASKYITILKIPQTNDQNRID